MKGNQMTFHTWALYAVAVFISTILPGPSVLLGLNHGLVHGKMKSVGTALGVTTAALIMGLVSLVGLGAVLLASGNIFKILKIAGACYLLYLGMQSWRHASQTKNSIKEISKPSASGFQLYRKGFWVGMSNPKAIIFFTALFPQFINPENRDTQQFLFILITLAVIVFFCMMLYSVLGEILSPLLKRPGLSTILNRLTGGLFAGFGITMLVSES